MTSRSTAACCAGKCPCGSGRLSCAITWSASIPRTSSTAAKARSTCGPGGGGSDPPTGHDGELSRGGNAIEAAGGLEIAHGPVAAHARDHPCEDCPQVAVDGGLIERLERRYERVD